MDENFQVINFVTNLDNRFGGPSKSVPSLSYSLIKNHHLDIQLCSSKFYENEENEFIEKYKLKWKSFPAIFGNKFGYNPRFSETISKLCTSNSKKTILHVQSPWTYPAYCAYTLSKKHNLPLIISPRSSFYRESLRNGRFQKFIAKHFFINNMIESASCIHVTSEYEMQEMRKFGASVPIAIIPNGIDISEFEEMNPRNIARKNLGIPSESRVILFLSRVNRRKRVEKLIDIFIKIHEKFPEWILLIVGHLEEPYHSQEIKSKLERLNKECRSKIVLKGSLTGQNRLDSFSASNIFVLPTKFENFGMAIAESLAAGLPTITTDKTPWLNLETLNAGHTIKSDLTNMQSALENLMIKSDKDLNSIGNNGREYVKNHYSLEEISNKMNQLYNWVLKKGSKPNFVFTD